MGNICETPLEQVLSTYAPRAHPIVGPLLRGGPAERMREYDLAHEPGYIDARHACYAARRALVERFLSRLGPPPGV